jgi:hypothetical protein
METILCERCGKRFSTARPELTRFCVDCRPLHRKERQSAYHKKYYQTKLKEKRRKVCLCRWCHQPVEHAQQYLCLSCKAASRLKKCIDCHRIVGHNNRFRCDDCEKKHHEKHQEYYRKWRRVHKRRLNGKLDCFWCEQPIPYEKIKKTGRREPPKFCSRDCYIQQRIFMGTYKVMSRAANEKQSQIARQTGERPGSQKRREHFAKLRREGKTRNYKQRMKTCQYCNKLVTLEQSVEVYDPSGKVVIGRKCLKCLEEDFRLQSLADSLENVFLPLFCQVE